MAASIRKLARHSMIYGLGHTLTRALSFLLLPLYTNCLTQEQFGVAGLLFSYLSIMTIIYGFGLDAAFLRYYVLAVSSAEKRQIMSTAFWVGLAIAIFFSSLSFILAAPLSRVLTNQADQEYLIKICAGILFFDALGTLFFLLLRAEERSLAFAANKLLGVAVTLALNYVLLVPLARGVAGIFEANLFVSALTFFILLPKGWPHLRFILNEAVLRKFLCFGLPYLPSTLAVTAIDNLDRYLLKALTDLKTVGIYSAGYRLGMIMGLVVAAFRFAWVSFYASASLQPNAPALFARILTYFHLGCAVVYLGVAFFIDDLVRLPVGGVRLFAQDYWQSTVIVPMVLLGYWLFGIYLNLLVGLHIKEQTKYLPLIAGVGLALNVTVNFLMIPAWGMVGAAWATVAAYAAMTVLGYVFSQKYYPIHYEYARFLKIAAITALLFGIARGGAFTWPWRILLLLAFPFLLELSGFFEKTEKERFFGWIKSVASGIV
jgi:O-antigen/teichoic acid export membrane protein